MTDVVNYAVVNEVDIIESETTIITIEELMSPTFIVLATGVAAATLIVILLVALICNRVCSPRPGYSVARVQVRHVRHLH